MNALRFCLDLHRANASVRRKLDEDLGFFHGIGWDDFALLSLLPSAPAGLPLKELAEGLGLGPSAALRRLPPLEKTGLVARERGADGLHVVLRAGGRRVLAEAGETASAVCEDALRADGDWPVAAAVLARLPGSTALRVA